VAKRQDKMLTTARKRLRMAIDAYSDTRQNELDDLKFAAGDSANMWQWPADVLSTRGSVQGQTINARPCITVNKLPQHIKQITNDQRQNRPSGKVIPADDKADVEVAEVFDGIIRHIEYMSNADVAYDTACENQVTYGEGYIRILTEYCDDDTFDQDIRIGRVRNSFSVFMDPSIQDPCGEDAEWCFITQDLLKEDYERQFPDAMPISSLQSAGVGDQFISQWLNENTVRIAEYFYYEHEQATLHLYVDGSTAFAGSPEAKQMEMLGAQPMRSRQVDRKRVKWVKTNGYEVLEESEWLGECIPVVRVLGNEFEVDGQVYISGIVRNAKDAQRMYNYWVSQEAEMLALAPKAPFIGYGGQFEGYEHQWKTANTTNWPYLEVNPSIDGAGNLLPLPQRSQPPMASSGLLQAKLGASDDIKSTTGQYDPALGAESNERTGRAIMARQRQTATGTYHYVDNLARAVRYVTRQIVDLIPKIYDTQRIARIIGMDGEVSMARIDPSQPQPVREIRDESGILLAKIYNPGIGKYDVRVTTGPSYMTQRQEALESMSTLLQGNPQLWAVAGDLFVKHMDWPGAQELSQRLAKTLDPKLLSDDDKSPELQAAEMQMQAMAQEMEQLHGMLRRVEQSMEAQELEIKKYDAETKRISAVQAGMSPEQIQDIVMGTIAAAIDTGDLIGGSIPARGELMGEAPQAPPPEMMPPGMPQ